MIRYYAAAFLFCVLGLVVALIFDRHLSALLFALGALCFAVRAIWAMRRPKPARSIYGNPSDWLARQYAISMTHEDDLVILPAGARLPNDEALRQLRKREAFRRYREHWARVGQ